MGKFYLERFQNWRIFALFKGWQFGRFFSGENYSKNAGRQKKEEVPDVNFSKFETAC